MNEKDREMEKLLEGTGMRLVGLDEEFRFGCTRCGKCCIHREDILLNPQDVFRMARELGMDARGFMGRYCEEYAGKNSRMPLVRLKPQGSVRRCPLLKDRKCAVHAAKPAVCAMFPVGRCITAQAPGKEGEKGGSVVRYVLNPISCGDRSETHTVRDWLKASGIPLEDRFFVEWHAAFLKLSAAMRAAERLLGRDAVEAMQEVTAMALYWDYDIDAEFLPQFEDNAQNIIESLKMFVPEESW